MSAANYHTWRANDSCVKIPRSKPTGQLAFCTSCYHEYVSSTCPARSGILPVCGQRGRNLGSQPNSFLAPSLQTVGLLVGQQVFVDQILCSPLTKTQKTRRPGKRQPVWLLSSQEKEIQVSVPFHKKKVAYQIQHQKRGENVQGPDRLTAQTDEGKIRWDACPIM